MSLRPVVVVALCFAGACHPLSCWHPADLSKDPPTELVSSSGSFPSATVDIRVDTLGVPHIFGESETDLAYGLGVMHGRDRQFQVYVYKHAGQGRLTELLGADLLEVDRSQRLLTYRLDELEAALSDRQRTYIEAYCAGMNDGAAMVGRSAEMTILGVEWEEFTVRDVLSIVRLQQWDQSTGFSEEMSRYRAVNALGASDPRLAELFPAVTTGGVPIVESPGLPEPEERTAGAGRFRAPSGTKRTATPATRAVDPRVTRARSVAHDLAMRFVRGGTGASNAWAVAPDRTDAGVAVIANDPHLGHGAPGVFYMAHLETDAILMVGGTFPGIPVVLIGHGKDVAWGITNSQVDVQDLVRLRPFAGRSDFYELDGQAMAFGQQEEVFRLGKGEDAEVVRETYRTSIFGMVLPPRYDSYGRDRGVLDDDDNVAVLWTATHFIEDQSEVLMSLLDLAQTNNIADATAALERFTSPPMNFTLAFTDGTIAYRLNGAVPVPKDGQARDFPMDGGAHSAGWARRATVDEKPSQTNPERGYVNASNQRIVDVSDPRSAYLGVEGLRPSRAQRIAERLTDLLADGGKPTTNEILSIQQDTTSPDTRVLAPLLGAHCPSEIEGHDEARVKAFCDAVAGFDGNYTLETTGALPFARLFRAFAEEVMTSHFDADIAFDILGQSDVQQALIAAIATEHEGGTSLLLDDPRTERRDGLDRFVARAAKKALDLIVAEAGGIGPSDWRWGKLHTLSLRGTLSNAPAVGWLFQTSAREEAGIPSAPRAENADFNNKMRVNFGAGLRLIAEMTTPPTVRLINDSGNSGHFGHRHLEDQNPLWSKGEPVEMWLSKDEIDEKLEGRLLAKPKD